MNNVIVYGPGCQRCETTAEMIKVAAARLGIAVRVDKESDYAKIAMAGVTSTPAVAIDGKLVHAGGLPDTSKLEAWLQA